MYINCNQLIRVY